MTQPPGISIVAYGKLATIRRDFLAMTIEERQAFVEALRAKRIRPPAPIKEPKIKAAKIPKEKKPRTKKPKGEPNVDTQ